MSRLEQALDAVAPDIEAYLFERREANLLLGVTHRGDRLTRAFRSPEAQLAAVPETA